MINASSEVVVDYSPNEVSTLAIVITEDDINEQVANGAFVQGQTDLESRGLSDYEAMIFDWAASRRLRKVAISDDQVSMDIYSRWAKAMTIAANSLVARISDKDASTDVDDISNTIARTFDLVLKFGPRSIDLKALKPEAINGEHFAALLRAMSTVKGEVPEWRQAVTIAAIALKFAGQDPNDALYGL